ncbi:MAG: NAD-dependent epimerase/dehydratase family protein [Candidatus Heimdallarchaeaceae archaeon]
MKVLVTGSFGNIGQSTLRELLRQGKHVICFDIQNKTTERIARKYAKRSPNKVDIFWGDITKIDSIQTLFRTYPDIDYVIHTAAIIPPLALKNPQLAHKVNVEGTRNLVNELEKLENPPAIFFTSSIAVYGDRLQNNYIRVTDELKPNLNDNYAESKISAEQIIKNSSLKYRIFRLSFITSMRMKPDPLMFAMPLDTSIELLDTTDVGLALANATNLPVKRSDIFNLAGGKANRTTYREMLHEMMRLFGFDKNPFPELAFAKSNFSCGFMDTSKSQSLFSYQRLTLDEYYHKISKKFRILRFFVRLFKPIITPIFMRSLLKNSPFYVESKNLVRKPVAIKQIGQSPPYTYKDKVFVVTGATGGIGKALVVELITRGAQVAAVGRSTTKFNILFKEMQDQNFSKEQLAKITFFEADLSSLNQVRQVASQIEDYYPRIDTLINNVGGYFSDRKITKDGFELTFGLNYLGQVLFTRSLLDRLNKSASANIIHISSSEHKHGRIHYGNLQLEKHYFGKTAYAQSKLAGMLFVSELAENLEECNIRVNAVHPGIVKTNIAQGELSLQSIAFRILKHTVAIDTSIAVSRILAILDNPQFRNITGQYISKDKVVKSHKLARNNESREKLWSITRLILEPWLKLQIKKDATLIIKGNYC